MDLVTFADLYYNMNIRDFEDVGFAIEPFLLLNPDTGVSDWRADGCMQSALACVELGGVPHV